MDKPLNVRCAEALGWNQLTRDEANHCWRGLPPGVTDDMTEPTRPRYAPREEVWPYGSRSETGLALTAQLIEQFGLAVFPGHDSAGRAHWTVRTWTAMRNGSCPLVHGDTLGHGVAEWVATYVENGEQRP